MLARMTEGARRQCRLALTRKNTETNDALQLALFSSNDWSEESRQVTLREATGRGKQCSHPQDSKADRYSRRGDVAPFALETGRNTVVRPLSLS